MSRLPSPGLFGGRRRAAPRHRVSAAPRHRGNAGVHRRFRDGFGARPRAVIAGRTIAVSSVLLLSLATLVPAEGLIARADVEARLTGAPGSSSSYGGAQKVNSKGADPADTVRRDEPDVLTSAESAALSRVSTGDRFSNDSRWTVQWPFRVSVPISDRFGARTAPTSGASTNHRGVDFTPGAGARIQAIADGVVTKVTGNDNSCGVHVVIEHVIGGEAVSSVYCHMQSGSVQVATGKRVSVGDTVGLVGNTGVTTGAHLHFEIRLNGTRAVDPIAWLKANAG